VRNVFVEKWSTLVKFVLVAGVVVFVMIRWAWPAAHSRIRDAARRKPAKLKTTNLMTWVISLMSIGLALLVSADPVTIQRGRYPLNSPRPYRLWFGFGLCSQRADTPASRRCGWGCPVLPSPAQRGSSFAAEACTIWRIRIRPIPGPSSWAATIISALSKLSRPGKPSSRPPTSHSSTSTLPVSKSRPGLTMAAQFMHDGPCCLIPFQALYPLQSQRTGPVLLGGHPAHGLKPQSAEKCGCLVKIVPAVTEVWCRNSQHRSNTVLTGELSRHPKSVRKRWQRW